MKQKSTRCSTCALEDLCCEKFQKPGKYAVEEQKRYSIIKVCSDIKYSSLSLTHTQRHRQRDTDTERQRERHRQRDAGRQTDRHRDRETHRERDLDTKGGTVHLSHGSVHTSRFGTSSVQWREKHKKLQKQGSRLTTVHASLGESDG